MLTDEAPWNGDTRTLVFVAAGMLATYGINHLWQRRSDQREQPSRHDASART
jgi:4-hydroxybenzoate polyprenyltransferase